MFPLLFPVHHLGVVKASMKQVKYSVKIILFCNGQMAFSMCDCPSGAGPHGTCKHVIAVMVILVQFSETGALNILKSCTEGLQTFHRPNKVHKGSPVKSFNLGKKTCVEACDPRPEHLRNRACYSAEVLMKTVNFAHQSGLDLSLRYAFPKADIQTASHDHDYLMKPFTEY